MEIPIIILYIYYIIYYIYVYIIYYMFTRGYGGFLSHGATPSSQNQLLFIRFLKSDFPWNQPSKYLGTPIYGNPHNYIIYIYIYIIYYILYVYQRVWWFPKSWSYPQFSKPVTFHPFSEIGFSMKSTIQVFGYPHLWKSPFIYIIYIYIIYYICIYYMFTRGYGGFLSHGATPSSQNQLLFIRFLKSDFPWNQPSKYLGTPIYGNPHNYIIYIYIYYIIYYILYMYILYIICLPEGMVVS